MNSRVAAVTVAERLVLPVISTRDDEMEIRGNIKSGKQPETLSLEALIAERRNLGADRH
jgi:hypothetical protein